MSLKTYSVQFDKQLCAVIQQIKAAKKSERAELVRQAIQRLKALLEHGE